MIGPTFSRPSRVNDRGKAPDRENQVVIRVVRDSKFSSVMHRTIFVHSVGVDKATFLQCLHTWDESITALWAPFLR